MEQPTKSHVAEKIKEPKTTIDERDSHQIEQPTK